MTTLMTNTDAKALAQLGSEAQSLISAMDVEAIFSIGKWVDSYYLSFCWSSLASAS
jgi:hypothetical protein